MNDHPSDLTSKNEKNMHFIRTIIEDDLKTQKYKGRVHTRFPPEPNGYLHIGHAKSICLNFGLAKEYNGKCNLRFDDTNPSKEEVEYVDSIKEDVKWLRFDWEDRLFFASDYFEKLYDFAVQLIKKGKAYVCDLTADQIREYRGTLTEPGKESPYRNRSVKENLDLFSRMKKGEFSDGSKVLRAKIDMSSPNINMRDPVIYRIKHESHHRTGDKWCIYPMYDYTHCISDSLEGITHSLCSLEFEDHRPLYEWFLDQLELYKPQQIEFAKLYLTFTVMSKRNLRELVQRKIVSGWDDPRMPTLAGFRRRGFTPEAIRNFAETVGVAKRDSIVDIALLEHCLREDLNKRAKRTMAVLKPLKLIIDNYSEDKVEELDAQNNPEDPSMGMRKIKFSREIYIEQDDFMENPPKKYFRLFPGNEIRLKHAYYVTCTSFKKDSSGNITEVHCTYDPESRGGWTKDGRKVMGTSHWVSTKNCVDAEVRLYNKIITVSNPSAEGEGKSFLDFIEKNSVTILKNCKIEPDLAKSKIRENFQFLRQGYFCVDTDSTPQKPVFNLTVSLKDSWGKEGKKR